MNTPDNKALAEHIEVLRDLLNKTPSSGLFNPRRDALIAAIDALTREPSTPSAQAGEVAAWTVVGPDGQSSIGGWHSMDSLEWSQKHTTLRDGHRYAFAFATPQPQVMNGDPSKFSHGVMPQPQGDASGQVSGGGDEGWKDGVFGTNDEPATLEASITLADQAAQQDDEGIWWVPMAAFKGSIAEIERREVAALSAPQARPDGGEVKAWLVTWMGAGFKQRSKAFTDEADARDFQAWRNQNTPAQIHELSDHPTPAPDAVARLESALKEAESRVVALEEGIEKALEEIEDAGRKALKYAAQALHAAMNQGATNGQE